MRSAASEAGRAAGGKVASREAFLAVARIARPQGRRGEVAADILTDFPVRFATLKRAFIEGPGEEVVETEVENAWFHKERIVLKFVGVDSIDQASALRGRHVFVPREEKIQLAGDRYYVWELEGCRVVTERNGVETLVGTVLEVEPTGGTDLLHVARAGAEGPERDIILVPLAREICKRIDTAAKRVVIDPPEDLLNLNRAKD